LMIEIRIVATLPPLGARPGVPRGALACFDSGDLLHVSVSWRGRRAALCDRVREEIAFIRRR
jgi:hypothetical protein